MGVHGAVTTGPLAAVVDIAPNFAGVILGIAGVMGLISGFISPIIVGLLTFENVIETFLQFLMSFFELFLFLF